MNKSVSLGLSRMYLPRGARGVRGAILGLVLLMLAGGVARGQSESNGTAAVAEPTFNRTVDVVYDPDLDGVALVMDVFTPIENPNGAAIVDVASGSWFSDRGKIRDHERAQFYQIFCGRGYVVFAIRPGSQTRFTGEEMLRNVKRGVRYVRHHAADYKIDPARIGIAGASAGGHLASLAAVTADAGDPNAKDPVDRESSKVKACGVFFPPADFVAWGVANILSRSSMKGLFFNGGNRGTMSDESFAALLQRLSPALNVTADAPPFLIFHGTKDPLVPMAQSEALLKALKAQGVQADLIIKEGGGHPWPTINEEVAILGDWFDKNL